MEYYSTIKKHVTMPFAATWMDILIVILSDSHPHDKCGAVSSTGILTLDQLPAPVPCTTYCLSLTPVSRYTVHSTKPLFLFYSPTGRVTEPPHGITSTTQRRLSWFLINMIHLSSHSHSLSHLISPGH